MRGPDRKTPRPHFGVGNVSTCTLCNIGLDCTWSTDCRLHLLDGSSGFRGNARFLHILIFNDLHRTKRLRLRVSYEPSPLDRLATLCASPPSQHILSEQQGPKAPRTLHAKKNQQERTKPPVQRRTPPSHYVLASGCCFIVCSNTCSDSAG